MRANLIEEELNGEIQMTWEICEEKVKKNEGNLPTKSKKTIVNLSSETCWKFNRLTSWLDRAITLKSFGSFFVGFCFCIVNSGIEVLWFKTILSRFYVSICVFSVSIFAEILRWKSS